jgi:cAMP-dependent protein kinase regulator
MNIDTKKYLENEVKPIMADLTHKLAMERPENPIEFILENLIQYFNYSNEPLTSEEREELKELRKQINIKRNEDIKNNPFLTISNEEDKKNNLDKQKTIKTKNPNPEIKEIAIRKPRMGISAEVFGIINKKKQIQLRVIKKTEDQKNRIKSKILTSFLFKNVEKVDVEAIILAMEEKIFEKNDIVIRQNDNGECLYIVEEGELICTKYFKENDEEIFIKKYIKGDSFGELALLYNTPRAATIKALSNCILWSLDRLTFNHIIEDSEKRKREKYEKFLLSVDILSTIDSSELSLICDAIKVYHFNPGDYIIKEVNFFYSLINNKKYIIYSYFLLG